MTQRKPRVGFIAWDFESSEHVERMVQQRLACGWKSEEVREKWTGLGREGKKTLYWVVCNMMAYGILTAPTTAPVILRVLRDGCPGREALIAQYIAGNPEESGPVHDTAQTHWLQPRRPTGRPIHPIGHIALDLRPEQNASLKLADEDIVWVAGLFISPALQSYGFGREAMQLAEATAAQPPLHGQWIVLDTMSREQQMSIFAKEALAAQGRSPPKVSNQNWSERQGYAVFAIEKEGYKGVLPTTGEVVRIDYMFMKKKS